MITAGFPRQPGMSRMDLLGKNAAIMTDVVANVVPGSPNAILIVVSNPLDEMTFLAAERSGFPKERVIGMAGVLDSARLRYFIAEELGVSPTEVEAMTLGSHGDAMVALPASRDRDGRPCPSSSTRQRSSVCSSGRATAAPRSWRYLKTGSAYYAPSASVVAMVEAIVSDTKTMLPVVRLGHGAVRDLATSTWACRRGSAARGVEEIVELDLNEDELGKLRAAAEGIRAKCADLAKL